MKLKTYIYYRFNRKTKYSIHSPFVYKLMTECVKKRINPGKILNFQRYKKQFFIDNAHISVNDFGAGSTIFKSNVRKVSQIAKIAGMSKAKAMLTMKLIEYFQPKNALEIGTSLGIGTAAMKFAKPDLNITTIEGCEQTAQVGKKYFEKNSLNNINLQIGNFDNLLPEIIKNQKFDLIYLDGNHTEKATLNYFNWCINAVHNDTLFIFDDIHWSVEMERAWNKIIENHKVTISIDLYHLGLIFFRNESTKQHFIL